MTTLYLARHGQTDYNRDGIVQGRGVDLSLNATGRAQADRLADRLADLPLDAIYASELKRAQETAVVVARHHPHLTVHHVGDFDEMAWGVWEGKTREEDDVEAVFEEAYRRWAAGEYAYRIEGGESILEVQARALRGIEGVLARHEGETVLVVSHGRLLRVLLASALPEYGLDRMAEFRHHNTSLSRLRWDGDRFHADFLNDVGHLQDDAA